MLPLIHMVVTDSRLGLVRQSQSGFSVDNCVLLGFDSINAPGFKGHGVDHKPAVESPGGEFVPVYKQEELTPAIQRAEQWMDKCRVPSLST